MTMQSRQSQGPTAEQRADRARREAEGRRVYFTERAGKVVVLDTTNIGRHDNRPTRRDPATALARHLGGHLHRWWSERRPDATREEVVHALRWMADTIERSEP
ncbi:Hypothetical protein I5071_19060 [Sandaracinus amylolyticus]|nr:Hypothetical protein I5071_19060 [Sandaracinus amylolyticus]